jgi:hypothetical protein
VTKAEEVFTSLQDGWRSVPELLGRTGWQPHTLRGALSTIAKKRGVVIERKREGGITFYRVRP